MKYDLSWDNLSMIDQIQQDPTTIIENCSFPKFPVLHARFPTNYQKFRTAMHELSMMTKI